MKAFSFLPILLLFVCSEALLFRSNLEPLSHRCFYEVLDSHQKYKVDVGAVAGETYSLKFYLQTEDQENPWQQFYLKQNIPIKSSSHLHKIAPFSTTYRFCIRNPDPIKTLTYQMQVMSGVQLMDLHLLPDNSDAENLALQISWIQEQQLKLGEMMEKVEGMKSGSKLLTNAVGSKINNFTIFFTCLVLFLNGFLYIRFKSAMKARKLI